SCKTTTEEQRTTSWMPFKSLSDGLNVETDLTIEGLPRPKRVFFILNKK
ncbi:MAG: tRNA 5-methoxyuridine(34)/uridine 5-oxyacetic acid(34) synthase CmoB, partial [Gammaproteobacteria bacterium]|nr:tRNA 5-methoxyuridine(34)/uridine 5-oxyacetic acid(34) synthase CmoB [Gammaproteobacteria bacterium]